jgi:hypothetical protein
MYVERQSFESIIWGDHLRKSFEEREQGGEYLMRGDGTEYSGAEILNVGK